jgi:Rad3-related DNA helicase
MFYGSIALAVAVVILLVIKGPGIFNPPKPPEKIVKDDSVVFTEVDKLRSQADKEFKAAIKIQSNEARNKAIRGALETLAAAQDKLQALSEEPRYKGKEEYDAVFEEVQNKISIEMKKYRDSIRLGD